MENIAISALEWLITAALAGAVGWLASAFKSKKTRDDSLELGMRALMRKEIITAYDEFHLQGKKLTIERKQLIDEVYDAYHNLGGNGTISHMYNEINNDIWIER